MKTTLLALLCVVATVPLFGCGSSSEAVVVPKAATEGGNVINDPKLKEQLTGPSSFGQGQPQSGLAGGN